MVTKFKKTSSGSFTIESGVPSLLITWAGVHLSPISSWLTETFNCWENDIDNITPNVPVISLTNVPGVSLTNEPVVSHTNEPLKRVVI